MNDKPRYVLFTGAGFTANFGGFLAEEMWAQIFSHKNIQQKQIVKDVFLGDLNYETVIHNVRDRKDVYNEEDRKLLNDAVEETYEKLDLIVLERAGKSSIHIPSLKAFIDRFESGHGYFFTLNQDLFVERKLLGPNFRPGIKSPYERFDPRIPFKEMKRCKVPSREEIEKHKDQYLCESNLSYIKLHGSQDWLSSTGSGIMVIGGAKNKQIENEPILDWYKRVFEDVISRQSSKILFIGYGFRDEHINDIIINALKKNKTEIFVICPLKPSEFREILKSNKCDDIWNSLTAYYPYKLDTFFPYNSQDNIMLESLKNSFFGKL